jgi:small subunit ribosomal protein S13
MFINFKLKIFMADNVRTKKRLKKSNLRAFLDKNYGTGSVTGNILSTQIGLNPRFRKPKLTKKHILKIKRKVNQMYVGHKMKKNLRKRIVDLIKLKTYRGMRHKYKLPSHGQRTRTNGKTKKKFRY